MATVVEIEEFGGPEVLRLIEADLPAPGEGEVRLEVRAAGVNPSDLKSRAGQFGGKLPRRLGSEVAGVVTAVGPGVSEVKVGDEVIGFRVAGGYASELIARRDAVTPKPATLPWEEAAGLLLTGATAVHLLTATAVGEGDVVLIHGAAGGVGQMAVQLAALRGARVIGTASPRNHDLLRELGAEPVAYGDGLVDRVGELAPEGLDVALDLIGTDEALSVSLALVADRDRVASIANFTEAAREAGIRLLGGGPGADPGDEIRDAARAELAGLAGEGRLRVRVAAAFPLADVAQAHRLVGAGHATGKVVLVP